MTREEAEFRNLINKVIEAVTNNLSETEICNLTDETIKNIISESSDRHRPGYYKDYNKKRKSEGKPIDRHRTGYYKEYAKTHPEWAKKHIELLTGDDKVKKHKKVLKHNSFSHERYEPIWYDDFDDMRDEDWGDWYPGDND